MLLTDPEIQNALETAKAAFPYFSDWEYQNETGGDYFGFSMWGVLTEPSRLQQQI